MHAEACRYQRDAKQHAHREPAPEKTELRVGLAEEFADGARNAVADGEGPGDEAGPLERAKADHTPSTTNRTSPSSAAS